MHIYPKRGLWYAPKWTHPQTGVTTNAHPLGTRDKREAEERWALERAGAIGAVLVKLPTANRSEKLSEAFASYLARKAPGIERATLTSYEGHAKAVLSTFGDWTLKSLAGPVGAAALAEWATAECVRLGRTHTVVKRLEAIVKPALRHAHARGELAALPVWPEIRSDYRAEGARKLHLEPEQFAALAGELPERDVIRCADGHDIRCHPRLWADVIVSTGLHDSDVSRFARADWDREKGQWFRRNTKGDAHYPAEWFPADTYLTNALERAADARGLAPPELFVASATPPTQWMRQRLRWASVRAGLSCKNCAAGELGTSGCPGTCFVPQPIDFRRTLATWLRNSGWEFDEVAKLLGNSTGMVREVYAQIPRARFVAAVAKAAPAVARLSELTRLESAGDRKGPRSARAIMAPAGVRGPVVTAVANPQNGGT